MTAVEAADGGPVRFARYAYPPNALGYCGPEDPGALLEYGAAGVADGGLRDLARGFEGAWPYLRLIAEANGLHDPLDPRVVEAYWVGNRLLDAVDPGRLSRFLEERFRAQAGRRWKDLRELHGPGVVPHHNLHVFGVYPWVGLLRLGHHEEPLRVLEGCRIRWGRVIAIDGDVAEVRTSPLRWDGRRLGVGRPRVERAVVRRDGLGLAGAVAPGDRVALHWGWVCERLDRRGVTALEAATTRALVAVNRSPRPAPAAVLA